MAAVKTPETRGDLVRRYRELRLLTQTELGAAAGMDQGSVSEIESGEREPGSDVMARFVNVLDIPQDEVARAYTHEVGSRRKQEARSIVVMNPPRQTKRKKT